MVIDYRAGSSDPACCGRRTAPDIALCGAPDLLEEPRGEVDEAHAPVAPDVGVAGCFDVHEANLPGLQPVLHVAIRGDQRVVCAAGEIEQTKLSTGARAQLRKVRGQHGGVDSRLSRRGWCRSTRQHDERPAEGSNPRETI